MVHRTVLTTGFSQVVIPTLCSVPLAVVRGFCDIVVKSPNEQLAPQNRCFVVVGENWTQRVSDLITRAP